MDLRAKLRFSVAMASTAMLALAALCLYQEHGALAAVAASISAATIGVAWFLDRAIFVRLHPLIQHISQVAAGKHDFSGPIADPLSGQADEISRLIAGFNEMLAQIRARDEQMRESSQRLGRQVTDRVAELQSAQVKLARAHSDIAMFLECVPSILIGLNTAGQVTYWNQTAAQVFRLSAREVLRHRFDDCGIQWLHPDMARRVNAWVHATSAQRSDDLAYQRDGNVRFVGFSIRPVVAKEKEKSGLILTGADVTEKKCLEEQLRQAHKLEAIGQLAAGIAHEINTPAQYVGDNTIFLKSSWESLQQVLECCRVMQQEAGQDGGLSSETLARFDQLSTDCDLSYLQQEIPNAINQSLEGVERVAKIVRAMKDFSHPGSEQKQPIDLNQAIEATVTVARSEWKHVADVELQLDPRLPLVPGLGSELKQVVLNLVVNAAHAITDIAKDGVKGKITVSSRRDGSFVEVSIRDTGCGIPEEIRSRVFEPFFTSKPVGKGTGQGLSLAHTIIVKGHQGRIWFETETGAGTTFYFQLPLEQPRAAEAASGSGH